MELILNSSALVVPIKALVIPITANQQSHFPFSPEQLLFDKLFDIDELGTEAMWLRRTTEC